MARFSEVFDDVTKEGHKIPKENYLSEGLYPIIDQGQEYIAGYSNDDFKLYRNVPAIIFGDHTRIIKYVDTPCFLGADGVKLLRAKNPDANYKYLYYALCNAKIPNTGYNRHFKWLKEIDIPIVSVQEQEHIVSLLDKINNLIALRKQQHNKLDELVKARFVEMFGNPASNPFGWEIKKFDEICENLDSRRIPITESKRKPGIYPYYGASGIVDYVDDYIFDEDLLLISEDGANLVARVTPIAFSVSGKVWVNNHAHVVRFEKRYTQIYVEHYFSQIDISNYITGTAQPKLNQAKLNEMKIPIPPVNVQVDFFVFYEKIQQYRLTIQQGLDKIEVMKKALMQKYFG